MRTINSSSLWEKFRRRHSPAALFQSWAWGEVQGRLSQPIWRFGLYDNRRLVAIFLVVKVMARRGSFLHLRHGPILASWRKNYWRAILTFMKNLGRQEKVWFARVSPLIADLPENRQFLKTLGLVPAAIHAMDAELCWVLDLDQTEEELLAHMRKTTRYEIRRAEKLGVVVAQTNRKEHLDDFLKLYEATAQRHGFVEHSGIREEFEIFAENDKALLLLGSFQGKPLGGSVILFDNHQAVYHHGASLPSQAPVSYLIQWEAIKEAKRRGVKVYNFWGIAPEDNPRHPWRGLTLFKTGFGGRKISYLHAHDLPLSALYFIPKTIETLRRLAKGY